VIEVTRKIVAVNVTLEENGREVIEPEFGAP